VSADTDDETDDATPVTVAEPLRADNATTETAQGTGGDARLATGTMLGRYVLLERIGAGGMGVVHAAYDPELDRRVAIKLIRAAGDARHQRLARERLLREAQSLAQLSHPNVVAIHDVGTFAGDVFLAMELVQGRSLRQVLADEPPPIAERRRILVAAGRGLAAAHRAGLVHRDVKPANILVADDGRVRVADFGLARVATDAAPSPAEVEADASSPRSDGRLRTPLTQHGSMVGTPAYMAPELLDGRAAGALSDQFSFCVTAFEALYGERPFKGDNRKALMHAIQRGEPRIPEGARVPARLRVVLLRGLAKDPAARYPSLDALLDELDAEPVLTPARVLLATTIAAVVGVAGWAIAGRDEVDRCAASRTELAGVWGDDDRAAGRSSFVASGAPYAATTAARVEELLDDYATAWTDMRTESCRATRERGAQSEHLLDLRTACLDRRRAQLAALVEIFADDADAALVRKAATAASALPPLAACADVDALTATVPPPDDPQVAAAVVALHVRLDQAAAQLQAGRYDQARELATPMVEEADHLGYQATRAEALHLLGEARLRGGDPKGAEAALGEAIRAAAQARDDRLGAQSWILLIYAIGQEGRYQDALLIRNAAEAAVDRAGGDPILRSSLLSNIGSILNQLQRVTESEALFAEAIALRDRAGATEDPELAAILSNMGNSLNDQGRHAEARTYYDRAIALWERTLGADHPQVAIPLNNLGNSLADQGEYADAERYYLRSIAVWQAAMGADFPNLAYPHNGLGGILNEQRRYDEAWPHFERAYELWKAQLGDDSADVGMALNNLGDVRHGQGRCEEALGYFERALAIDEKAIGPDSEDVTFPLTGIGECQLVLGHPAEALIALERAWRIRADGSGAPLELSTTQFALARAVRASGDRRRARQLATEARQRLGDAPQWATWRAEIDAWLGTH
jgi:tetratricopeptide (TPR) repeat protein